MNGKELNEALVSVQSKLKAPKGQYNSFGKYKYRSCEDILEAVKPLLAEVGCTLRISDEIMQVGERIYVKATAVFSNGDAQYAVTALAREAETKPGMDAAQITGAASSYARKYALNGLFCIDDTKDPDATNTHGQEAKPKTKKEQMYEDSVQDALDEIKQCNTVEDLTNTYKHYPMLISEKRFIDALSARKKEIKS